MLFMFFKFKGTALFLVGVGFVLVPIVILLLIYGFGRTGPPVLLVFLASWASEMLGFNLIGFGLLNMLRHLYGRVSQMDLRTDRPLRWTGVFLMSQFLVTMASLPAVFMVHELVWANVRDRPWLNFVLMFFWSPGAMLVALLGMLFGFVAMLYDFYVRVHEIRQNPRFDPRRRVDEAVAETPVTAKLIAPPDPSGIQLPSAT